MGRPIQRYRHLLATLAILQATAPPAAALADAAVAEAAQWLGIHVEERGAGPHDHPPHLDDCFFCQFLGQHAVAPQPDCRVRLAPFIACFAIAQPIAPKATVAPHLPDSRAPPSA